MPVHVPAVLESVWPCMSEPDTVGTAVFAGADSAATTAVAAEVAVEDPAEFDAVTLARSV